MVEKIRCLCKKSGDTLASLERTLGFGNGTIARWGTRVPSVDKVKAVADYFGCTVDELLEEEDGSES